MDMQTVGSYDLHGAVIGAGNLVWICMEVHVG